MRYISIIILTLFLITGCSKNVGTESDKQFNTSPTFALPVTFRDITKGEYILIGQENKVAVQIGSGPIGNAEVFG